MVAHRRGSRANPFGMLDSVIESYIKPQYIQCLIGNKYRPFALPASIDASEYNHIHNAANEAGLDASLLDNHFLLDTNLLPPRYVLQAHNKSDNNAENNKEPMNKIHQESEESNWPEEEDKLVRIIQYGARIAIQEGLIEAEDLSQSYLFSGKKSLSFACGKVFLLSYYYLTNDCRQKYHF
ncbi:uncharacterized protein TNCV_527021 [Trichonephila clavipes]|nr:uncharacterized protein TNCV_527021 [Trichonephila clavipes]